MIEDKDFITELRAIDRAGSFDGAKLAKEVIARRKRYRQRSLLVRGSLATLLLVTVSWLRLAPPLERIANSPQTSTPDTTAELLVPVHDDADALLKRLKQAREVIAEIEKQQSILIAKQLELRQQRLSIHRALASADLQLPDHFKLD